MKRRIVLLGPPASGKGTQANLIGSTFGIPIPSIGEMLREEHAAGTELGHLAAEYTDKGRLVPDDIVIAMVRRWLDAHGDGFLFDGFPRTLAQAEAFEKLLAERNTPLELALSLEPSDETIRRRVASRFVCVKCKRAASVGLQIKSGNDPCPASSDGEKISTDAAAPSAVCARNAPAWTEANTGPAPADR